MTKLRTIDAVVNTMIANPNATTYDFTVGRDAQGDYIEKRSAIASKIRQWRGKHVHVTGDDARARYNRDKVVINDFQVARLIQRFARQASAENPLSLFGSKKATTLLTSYKAAEGTYFKARYAARHEAASQALKHYEIMVRSLEAGRRPKIETPASHREVLAKISENWLVRAADDVDSNAGSVASELNRLGTTPGNIWLGNAKLDEIEQENDDLNNEIAHGPQVAATAGAAADVTTSLFRAEGRPAPQNSPAKLHAMIYQATMEIALLKDSLQYESEEQRAVIERKIAERIQHLNIRTATFVSENFDPIPKDKDALEAYIDGLDGALFQYNQKVLELQKNLIILDEEEDQTIIDVTQATLTQVTNARDGLNDRLRAAHSDLQKLSREEGLSLGPNIARWDRNGEQNPFGKLPQAQQLSDLLEFSKDHKQTINPGTEALTAVDILTAHSVNAPKATTALALFVDEIGIKRASDTEIVPLTTLASSYEKYISPAVLGAKREISRLNQEIAKNLGTTGRLVSQFGGRAVVEQDPWNRGLIIKLQGPFGADTIIPCGIQADGSFIVPGKNGALLKYELPAELTRKVVNSHIYLDLLAKKAVDVRREFTRGLRSMLAPNAADPKFLEAYANNKAAKAVPQAINVTLISSTDDRGKEEAALKATSYAHDQRIALRPRTVSRLDARMLIQEDSAQEVARSFVAYAKGRFFDTVDVKAGRHSALGGDITKAQVKIIATNLTKTYTDSLDNLRAELQIAQRKLDEADDAMRTAETIGSIDDLVAKQVDIATFEFTLLQAKIELAIDLQARAIELNERPELFWERT